MQKRTSNHILCNWLKNHQRRLQLGESIPTISKIALMAGISRQTLYAVLRNERTEFGEVAQIRLSRVIQQISGDPAYQGNQPFLIN